jgi:hypothetical protein
VVAGLLNMQRAMALASLPVRADPSVPQDGVRAAHVSKPPASPSTAQGERFAVHAGRLNHDKEGDETPVLVAKGNCGVPKFVDGAIRYDGTPELMAVYACMALDAGARIVGGCCGTTPEHLRAMRHALEAHTPSHAPTMEEVQAQLGEVSRGARALWDGTAGPAARPARGARATRAAPAR